MSRKSPGSEDSRGSPERPRAGTVLNPTTDQLILNNTTAQQNELPSIQTLTLPMQQNATPRDVRENSVVHGGLYSPRQSRLVGYLTSSSISHRSLPQSYQAGQAFMPSLSQSYSDVNSDNEATSFGDVEERMQTSFSTPQLQIPPFHISQNSSLQRVHPARGSGSSPPAISHAQTALPQAISQPQRPRTLLPPITTLSADMAARCIIVGQSPSPTSLHLPPAQPPASASPDELTPLPQNLRGDPFRSAKVKTEICRYFGTPKGCIFGDKCNYAHGEHELKFNKLADLEAAGLIDVEVFRCHVCFIWVATGACPFDLRCARLHDPRVIGNQPSWLAHAEVLSNNTKKGREVDKLYHQQYCSIYSCSPIYGFAPKKRWKANETSTNIAWKEFYSFCCNMDANHPHSQGMQWSLSPEGNTTQDQSAKITEIHRLAIALKTREQRNLQCYTYLPSHMFCGVLCMVLQTHYFELEVVESFQDVQRHQVVHISKEEAINMIEAGKDSHLIVAQEIAFGPVADASVHQASIWFNINSDDIVPCTRQQARRHRRSRHRIRVKRNYNEPKEEKLSSSCSIPPFMCHQPVDDAAFNLITRIQSHRYSVLKYFSSSPNEHVLRSLALEEEALRTSFESQRRFWMTWTWPKKVWSSDLKTEVPAVDGIYNFVTHGDPGYREDPIFFGSEDQEKHTADNFQIVSKQAKLASGFVWKSFVMNLQLLSYQGAADVPGDKMPTHDPIISTLHRLPVFRDLSLGHAAVLTPFRVIPTLCPQQYTSAPAVISLDVMIREWSLILQRQTEEMSSHPLRDVKQGNSRHPSVQRRPLSYSFNIAAHSLRRDLPKLEQN